MITFSEHETPRRIVAWLHRQIAAKSPRHAEMVAAYRERRKLPDDRLPAVAGLPHGSRYGQGGGAA